MLKNIISRNDSHILCRTKKVRMANCLLKFTGGGFALSKAASKDVTDLNGQLGTALKNLEGLPNPLILLLLITFTVIVTNFASNVATASIICPIAMTMASYYFVLFYHL